MGRSAIDCISQPVPCSHSNRKDITNISCVEDMELVDGSTIVAGAMLLGG